MKTILKGLLLASCLLFTISLLGCQVYVHDDHRHDHHRHGPPWHGRLMPVNFSQNGNGQGDISFTLPNGETYEGKYTTAAWSEAAALFSKADYQAYSGTTAIPEGSKYEQITAYGGQDKMIQAEFFTSGPAFGHGLVKDSEGNIFEITQ